MQTFFEHYLAHNTRQNQSFSFDIMNIYHEQIGTWPNAKYEI